MSKIRPEERFPLLLYFVDNSNDLSKTNKKYFDKSRFHGINNGATAVFTEWPNYISTCWVATILSGLFVFMMMLLLLSSISSSGARHRIPRCVPKVGNQLDNKTVHLVHGPSVFQENQLEFVEKVIQSFPQYKIHLILIENGKQFSGKNKTDHIPKTQVGTSPSTTMQIVANASTPSGNVTKKRLALRRRKRNLEKRLENLHFSIKLGAKRLLDILMHHKQNNSIEAVYSIDTTQEPKLKTVEELLEKYPEIIVENTTFAQIFHGTPLHFYYGFFSNDIKTFAVRVMQLWQYGGISFDLEHDFKDFGGKSSKITEIIVNPTEKMPDSKYHNKSTKIIPNNNGYVTFLQSQYVAYENLPMGVVTADDKGVHMESKTPCHAFFGEIIVNLKKLIGNRSVKDVLRGALWVFCKHSVADKRYCETL